MPDLTDESKRIAELEKRLTAMEDKEAIQRVQYMYGYYIDNHMWDEMADLFADHNAPIEIGRRGKYVGKERIRTFLIDVLGKGRWGLAKDEFFNHIQLQPVITLDPDGMRAKARARALIQVSALPDNTRLRWADGIYENAYVKENGVWKIESMWWAPTFYAFMLTGEPIWFDSMPPSESFPPDTPSHAPDDALGRIFPPFHYVHPITGHEVPSHANPRRAGKK